jgi:hypothetical protein
MDVDCRTPPRVTSCSLAGYAEGAEEGVDALAHHGAQLRLGDAPGAHPRAHLGGTDEQRPELVGGQHGIVAAQSSGECQAGQPIGERVHDAVGRTPAHDVQQVGELGDLRRQQPAVPDRPLVEIPVQQPVANVFEGGPEVAAVGQVFDDREVLGQRAVGFGGDDLAEQALLVAEVVVDRGLGDAGLRGDRVDAGPAPGFSSRWRWSP